MIPDHVQVKAGMRAMWAEGDWSAIAAHLDEAARALVVECGLEPGHQVLDVAAGNGNVTVWAARTGARVTATDLSPAMVEQGRQRCATEGLDVQWREADMEELPFLDATFDLVLSAFGISFAPRLEVALGEMFRVVGPGGCVGLVDWTRDGWPAQIGAILQRHLFAASSGGMRPTRHEAGSPGLGGWLVDNAATVRIRRGVVWQRFTSAQAWWDHWHASAPQMAIARSRLSPDQYQELRDELIASADDASTGRTDCHLGSEYLLVVATKRPEAGGPDPAWARAATVSPGRAPD